MLKAIYEHYTYYMNADIHNEILALNEHECKFVIDWMIKNPIIGHTTEQLNNNTTIFFKKLKY